MWKRERLQTGPLIRTNSLTLLTSLVFLSLSPHPPPSPFSLPLPLFVFCIPRSFQCLKWRLLQLKCLCMCARACNSPISLLISLQSRCLAGGGEEGVAHAGGPGPGGREEEEEWERRGAGTADTYGWVPETGWNGWRWRKRGKGEKWENDVG